MDYDLGGRKVNFFRRIGEGAACTKRPLPVRHAVVSHDVPFLLCFFFPFKPGLLQRAISRLFKHKFYEFSVALLYSGESEREEFINM